MNQWESVCFLMLTTAAAIPCLLALEKLSAGECLANIIHHLQSPTDAAICVTATSLLLLVILRGIK